MFYRIAGSADNKIIGNVNIQFQNATYGGDIHSPNYLSQVLLKDVDLNKVTVPFPILNKGTKVTDLVVGTCYGNHPRLLISDKLKNLLESGGNNTLKFIKTHITHKNIIYPNYWFTHPLGFQMEVINYKLSEIHEYNVEDYTHDKTLKIKNLEDFIYKRNQYLPPKGLTIKKLVINHNSFDVLILERVKAGISYYISEKLKKEIEDAGCTGIEFEPIYVKNEQTLL